MFMKARAEAATGGVLQKKVFLEISQKSQENTCAKDTFLIKKSVWRRCFPVNFVKFLRIPFLQNTSGRLLLQMAISLFKGIIGLFKLSFSCGKSFPQLMSQYLSSLNIFFIRCFWGSTIRDSL